MKSIEEYINHELGTDVAKDVLCHVMAHRSAGEPNNERLEFLGNAVLNMRLAEVLYNKPLKLTPGSMSLACNYLRSNEVLVLIGREGGLEDCIHVGPSVKSGRVTDKMVSTAFEAAIGALYEQKGYEAASSFVDRYLLTDGLIGEALKGKGPITELKEIAEQSDGISIEHRRFDRVIGGRKVFYHATTFNGRTFIGLGRTKKGAETRAASASMMHLSRPGS